MCDFQTFELAHYQTCAHYQLELAHCPCIHGLVGSDEKNHFTINEWFINSNQGINKFFHFLKIICFRKSTTFLKCSETS
jgi:hypothetical protein